MHMANCSIYVVKNTYSCIQKDIMTHFRLFCAKKTNFFSTFRHKNKYVTSFTKHFLHLGCSLSGAWLYCDLNHFLHMLNHLHYQGQIQHQIHNQIFIITAFISKNSFKNFSYCIPLPAPFLPFWSCEGVCHSSLVCGLLHCVNYD